ncbi:ATP-dependent Clp protease adapter protein CLPS1, chloroplastic [Linum perenne]
MVTALCGRITLSPHPLFNPNPQGEKNTLRRGRCNNRQILMSVSAPTLSKGGGVLDRPVKEKSKPGRDSEFDLRGNRGKCLLLIR